MRMITTTFIALCLLTSCSEAKEETKEETKVNKTESVDSTSNIEPEKEVQKEDGEDTEMKFTPYDEYSNFLTNTLIEQTCELKHKEICEDGSVSGGVEVKVCYFTPPGWDHDFAYCQVSYISEEAKEYTHFLFYPDDNGLLSNERFSYIEEADLPCIDCQLKDIKIEDEKIIGVFYDFMGYDTDTFTRIMDYNFAEMTVSWSEK